MTGLKLKRTMIVVLMERMIRPFLVFGLILAIGGSAWAECLAGEMTPEQMACCAAMNHDCGAAGLEMGCCPTEPQTRDGAQAAIMKPSVPELALATGPLAVLPEPHERVRAVAAASFDREALKLPDRPTYLVLSVFLI